MKRYILILLMALIVFVYSGNSVEAQITQNQQIKQTIEYDLPYPGILPDNNLYFVKKIRDLILLTFTKDPIKKSQTQLLIADKTLVMGKILWEQDKYELSVKTFKEAEIYLENSVLTLVAARKKNILPPGVVDKLELALKKHLEIILIMQVYNRNKILGDNLIEVYNITDKAIKEIALLK